MTVEDHFIEKIVAAVQRQIRTVTPERAVYLAGPIMGCTLGEANDWRKWITDQLAPHGLKGMSPLRCEPIHGEVYSADYPDPLFGTPRAIASKNLFDVTQCDMTIAFFPHIEGKIPSLGTIIECGWAKALNKGVIVCTDDPVIARHPVLDSCAGWKLVTAGCPGGDPRFKTIEDCLRGAVEVCAGVIGGYTGGKNV